MEMINLDHKLNELTVKRKEVLIEVNKKLSEIAPNLAARDTHLTVEVPGEHTYLIPYSHLHLLKAFMDIFYTDELKDKFTEEDENDDLFEGEEDEEVEFNFVRIPKFAKKKLEELIKENPQLKNEFSLSDFDTHAELLQEICEWARIPARTEPYNGAECFKFLRDAAAAGRFDDNLPLTLG